MNRFQTNYTRRSDLFAGVAIACGCMLANAGYAQPVDNVETEPNNTKQTATIANSGGGGLRATPPPAATDRLVGISAAPGTPDGSADYFQCHAGPENVGLYCYYLEKTQLTDVEVTMRGLAQVNSIIVPFSDVLAQTPNVTPIKTIWYGFGQEERLYVRIQGRGSATAYSLNYRCEPYRSVPPNPTGGDEPWQRGAITLTASSPTAGLDLDLWVYDHNFVAIPDYGRDDPDAMGLTRHFMPGKYYVAVTDGNLLNNLPSPADDTNRNKPVLDFPGLVAGSSDVFPIPMIMLTIDQGGIDRTVGGPKLHRYQVLFFEFNVADDTACSLCAADYNSDGGVDGSDVQAFFDHWTAGDACADVNGSGGIDGSDVQTFFDLWQTGGC